MSHPYVILFSVDEGPVTAMEEKATVPDKQLLARLVLARLVLVREEAPHSLLSRGLLL
jgi:hypothetical protein